MSEVMVLSVLEPREPEHIDILGNFTMAPYQMGFLSVTAAMFHLVSTQIIFFWDQKRTTTMTPALRGGPIWVIIKK
jgi:hypothetical protein